MRRKLIYGVFSILWFVIACWQFLEHQWAWEAARRNIATRAHDLPAVLSVFIRSQERVALIPKPQLEAALSELVKKTNLESVMLLSASREPVASAGRPMTANINTLLEQQEVWSSDSASFANLIALGSETDSVLRPALLSVDITRKERPEYEENRQDYPEKEYGRHERRPEEFLRSHMFDPLLDETKRESLIKMMGETPLTTDQVDMIVNLFPREIIGEHRVETLRRTLVGRPFDQAMLEDVLLMMMGAMHPPGPPPDQPPWMNRKEYDQLMNEHGVHWFLVTIPTITLHEEMGHDFLLRCAILGGALLACLALGLAWRTFERSSSLEIQLVRARENTNRLEELNLTAAGLVHETKNPLNLIRGLAQMIGREASLSPTVRNTAVKITEETDRVTGRLNQFLDYARPVQPHPQRVPINALIRSIFDILAGDLEEKSVTFSVEGPNIHVMADENMLRQVLFNLLLNAVQAVPYEGRVAVCLSLDNEHKVNMDVRDNGPGIDEKDREEVFRPYFTMSAHGTGLGLAVVRQIALAHGWQIACIAGDGGAVFRVRGIGLAENGDTEKERG